MRITKRRLRRWIPIILVGGAAAVVAPELLAVALRASLAAEPAPATAEPVELHPVGDFTHPTAGFAMPEAAGPFQRVAVTQ